VTAVGRSAQLFQNPGLLPRLFRTDPARLKKHENWDSFFTGDHREALRTDIEENGVLRPVLITGERCASEEGTVLDGWVRVLIARELGIKTIPVISHSSLSADQELHEMVQHNLSDQLGRRLSPSRRFRIVEKLVELLPERSGRPPKNPVGTNGVPRGDTRDIIARRSGLSVNEVANLQKVFGSPVATARLKAAVDREDVSLSKAAGILRTAEKRLKAAPKELEAVCREVDRAVDGPRTGEPASTKVKPASAGTTKQSRRPEQTTIDMIEDGVDAARGEGEMLGRRIACLLDRARGKLTLEDLGPAVGTAVH
jgi:hypothetical protein